MLLKWLEKFQWEIRNNLRILEFRTRTERRSEKLANNVDQLDANLGREENEEPKCALLVPYIPGISDRLKMVASRYSVKSWFSYGGKIGDGLSATYKERAHISKMQNSVYKAYWTCGEHYVGELTEI